MLFYRCNNWNNNIVEVDRGSQKNSRIIKAAFDREELSAVFYLFP